MTRVGDTSILYALFDEDDEHHERAREALAEPEPIEVPSEILVETVDLVEYRAGWALAAQALAWLLGRPNVRIAEQVHVPAVREVYNEGQEALSLADAFVVQTCRALGAEPLSADRAIVEAVG